MAGHVDPDREARDLFKSLPRDEPVHMLNLVRVRPLAEYPQDHLEYGKGRTGREACEAYGRSTAHILSASEAGKFGQGVLRSSTSDLRRSGGTSRSSRKCPPPRPLSPWSGIRRPRTGEHRTAAVADSRLIRMAAFPPGEGLGE